MNARRAMGSPGSIAAGSLALGFVLVPLGFVLGFVTELGSLEIGSLDSRPRAPSSAAEKSGWARRYLASVRPVTPASAAALTSEQPRATASISRRWTAGLSSLLGFALEGLAVASTRPRHYHGPAFAACNGCPIR
jgi:hypothetical protein